ncbi:hypothetical protein Bbelb_193350 [Branchiostoma belcheri]|nr:hypothetical protein Bbelb_193350 [Branchiostoma belcheri]
MSDKLEHMKTDSRGGEGRACPVRGTTSGGVRATESRGLDTHAGVACAERGLPQDARVRYYFGPSDPLRDREGWSVRRFDERLPKAAVPTAPYLNPRQCRGRGRSGRMAPSRKTDASLAMSRDTGRGIARTKIRATDKQVMSHVGWFARASAGHYMKIAEVMKPGGPAAMIATPEVSKAVEEYFARDDLLVEFLVHVRVISGKAVPGTRYLRRAAEILDKNYMSSSPSGDGIRDPSGLIVRRLDWESKKRLKVIKRTELPSDRPLPDGAA